jgi:hypothetical protein
LPVHDSRVDGDAIELFRRSVFGSRRAINQIVASRAKRHNSSAVRNRT